MRWYVYRMEGRTNGTFRSEEHPHVVAYLAKHGPGQRLYEPVDYWAPTLEEDFSLIRRMSTSNFCSLTVSNRMLRTRAEWSKK